MTYQEHFDACLAYQEDRRDMDVSAPFRFPDERAIFLCVHCGQKFSDCEELEAL